MACFEEYKARIGRNVRRLRAQSGMSLRVFGTMVGVHYNQLHHIEQGRVNPSLETLCKIAAGFDVTVEDLLKP